MNSSSVADPGFPRGGGGGATLRGRGCQHTILPKFPKNCMKLKEFGPQGGARVQKKFESGSQQFCMSAVALNSNSSVQDPLSKGFREAYIDGTC